MVVCHAVNAFRVKRYPFCPVLSVGDDDEFKFNDASTFFVISVIKVSLEKYYWTLKIKNSSNILTI